MRRSSGHLVVIDTNCLLQMLGRHSIYRALWEAFLKNVLYGVFLMKY